MCTPSGIPTQEIYKRDKELKKVDVESLQDWAARQPHLPEISELQTILFLQSCYYSNELAKTTIDNYYTVKSICSDIFGDRSPNNPTVRSTTNVSVVSILPKLNHLGYSTVFCKLVDCNPENYVFSHQIRQFDMLTMLHLHQNGPMNGLTILFDMQGSVIGHLLRMNIMTMKKLLYYLQEAMPIRLKGIHFINVVPWMDKLLAMMKPFMKQELNDNLHIHTSLTDSLYKYIPKECMPSDYGGVCEPVNILHEKMKKAIMDNAAFFHYEENQVVDESKRMGRPKNAGDYFGVEGTFKKLEVD